MLLTIMRKSVLLLIAVVGFTAMALAQKTVTGKVTNKNGDPAPGISVTVKNSKKATTTDAQGNYTLSDLPAGSVIEFSGVGFNAYSGKAGESGVLNVSLESNVSSLNEVVMVGYGSSRKKDQTGSISSVKAKDFNQGVIASPDQLLQGKVAGLQVTNASGQPGAATIVRIRGFATVRSGTGQPLYVIDGVPLDGRTARPGFNNVNGGIGSTPDVNPLLYINPNDIASIDVLKDASACAIYGSRGSNGVILITLKKGVSGQPRMDFNYSVGVSNQFRKYQVATAGEYRDLLHQYNLSNGDFGGNVDAQSAILQTGISHNIGLGFSAGAENNNYRLSLNYQDIQGIIKGSDMKKYIASFKGSAKFLNTKKLALDYVLSMAKVDEQIVPITDNAGYTGSLMSGAISWNPTLPLTNSDGSFHQLGTSGLVNPLALLAYYHDKANLTNLSASLSPSYKFNEHFEIRATLGINNQTGLRRVMMDSTLQVAGVYQRGLGYYANNELNSLLYNNTLTYNQKIASKLNLNAVIGYEYQKFVYKGVNISGQDFTSTAVDYTNILQNASQSTLAAGSFADPSSELQSFFGRFVLNYSDKYLLTGTVRADGSSKFGSNHRYGYFPSFAAKWNVSNEDFLKDNKVFSNVALRAGWGITGNQEFPAGASQDQYTFVQGGLSQYNYSNPDLTWEKTTQTNIGLDFQLLKKLNVQVDYFNKNTTDLLFNVQVPLPGPATKYWKNLPMNIINKGVEVLLGAEIVKNKSITWNANLNVAFLNNEINNYTGGLVLTGGIAGQGLSGVTSQQLANGQPLNTFNMLQFAGLNSAGFSTFTDPSGTPQVAANANTKYFVGSAIPKTTLGFSTDVSYKKWTLSASLYGAFGQKIFNNTALAVLPISKLGVYNVDSRYLIAGENVNDGIVASTRYLENGSYLKLSNVTLKYTVGDIHAVKNLTFFVTGQNLLWITKYKGVDPEINTNRDVNGVSSFGIEYTPYPTARTFQFGLNFSL